VLVARARLPVLQLATLRLLVGGAALFVLLTLRGRALSTTQLRASRWGGVWFATSIVTMFAALGRTSVADASIMSSLQPLVLLIFTNRRRASDALVVAGSVIGAALVVAAPAAGGRRSLGGDLLAILALFSSVGYLLSTRRARSTLSATQVQCGVQLAAAGVLLPVLLAFGRFAPLDWSAWSTVLLVALLPGAGHVIFAWAVVSVSPRLAAQIGLLNPVLAVLLGAAVLGQPLDVFVVTGMALVLTTLAVAVRTK
jgi:drug/metabolite transporter (DMT)-like permease